MKQRVCLVSQHEYPGDPRLTTEVRSLLEAGYVLDMVCMRTRNQPLFRVEDGVNIYRIPSVQRKRASISRYVVEYLSFFVPAFLLLAVLQIVRGYRVVHVTNLPDMLVFSALIPKLLGARIIFDVRECTPEMFIDRFNGASDGFVVRLMVAIERASVRFADASLTCTEQMRQALIQHKNPPEDIFVMLNMPAAHLECEPVLPDPTDDIQDEFRIVTHGTVIRRYGHELLIEAMAEVVKQIPQAHLMVYGRGEALERIDQRVEALGLRENVTLAGYVAESDLLAGLRRAHVGVVSVLQNPESDLVHTHKMFEYIQLGIPTIISRTTAVAAYFDDQSLFFFEPNDPHALAQAIVDSAGSAERRYAVASHALKVYEQYSPEKQRACYVALVARLLSRSAGPEQLEVNHET